MKNVLLLTIVAIVLLSTSDASSQETSPCGEFDKSVRYKMVVRSESNRNGKRELYMQIFLKPALYRKGAMLALAERLVKEYCEFDELAVFFREYEKITREERVPVDPLIESDQPRLKGYFEFSKADRKGEMDFDEIGRPKNEAVRIFFSAQDIRIIDSID